MIQNIRKKKDRNTLVINHYRYNLDSASAGKLFSPSDFAHRPELPILFQG